MIYFEKCNVNSILEAHRRAIVHWQRRILRSLASYCRKRVRVLVDLLPAIQRDAVLLRMWRIWQRGVRQQKESVCKCVAMFQCRCRLSLGTHLRFWWWRSRRRTILDEMGLLVLRKSGVTETRMQFTRWKCAYVLNKYTETIQCFKHVSCVFMIVCRYLAHWFVNY